nr:cbb3-type cytochrome c oxidase subunit I [Ardenticatena sp.]
MHQRAFARDDTYIKWQLALGFAALFLGILMGLFQGLDRMGIDLYKYVGLKSYYQGLTIHGVLNVLVFTTAFNGAFLPYVTMRALKRPMALKGGTAIAFWLMLVGVLLATWKILDNSSTVLFTFYPPLQGHPLFYLGLVLVVVSSWVTFLNILLTTRAWKQDHPGEALPLQAFISLVTYIMWFIASMGVATEVLVLILPWSLGIVEKTDPQLARTLFWLTGHPIVYFWLLPAYVSWYTMLPKQVGGKILSDPLVRLVFILFLLLSTPVGFHHQYTDPGVPPGWKAMHALLTFSVFFPSMITAYSVVASLEIGGRKAGGKGLFGWIWKLPWGDPAVTAQLLAGLGFFLGGVSGLINASYNINMVIHNTAFVPGHFHLTVGTAVTLTAMGIMYWLLPALTGKKLWGRGLALANVWLWFIGVMIFSRGQMAGGLEGMPRRTWMATATYLPLMETWDIPNKMTAIGGTLMFLGGMAFFAVMVGTLLFSRERVKVEMPAAEAIIGPEKGSPLFTKRLDVWTVVAVVLILIAYVPYLVNYLGDAAFVATGQRVW